MNCCRVKSFTAADAAVDAAAADREHPKGKHP